MTQHNSTPERGHWSRTIEFILSSIGFSVGVGFIWRFPYICYKHGGGAFLVPYVILMLITGIPLFFLEISLGQFTSKGATTTWSMCPLFKGIGWAMILIISMIAVYYNAVVMYAMLYFFVSLINLGDLLPWRNCDNHWNTPYCRTKPYPDLESMNETDRVMELLDITEKDCLSQPWILQQINVLYTQNLTSVRDMNSTMLMSKTVEICKKVYRTPAEEYWSRYVTKMHESEPERLMDIGGVNRTNLVCLLWTWILLFFCLMKNIRTSGKIVYFTATFPFAILIAIFATAVNLEGSEDGIQYFINPDWEKLKEAEVWTEAAGQVFFSVGITFGCLISMGSYNKFNNNTLRFSLLVPLVNCAVNVLGGFVVFAILGHMSYLKKKPVSEVTESGPGLVFVVFPEVIAKMAEPWPPIFAILFYSMMIMLGFDAEIGLVQTVITGFTDISPRVLRKHNTIFTLCVCLIGFILGIPLTCKGGIYVLTLMDWYSGAYNSMVVGICELVAVCWIYGVRNFRQDIEMMLGHKPDSMWILWYSSWMFIAPAALLFILVISGITYTPAHYIGPDGKYEFPSFTEVVGWAMAVTPMMAIVVGMVVQCFRRGGIRGACRPDSDWGPALDENRTCKYCPDDRSLGTRV